MAQLLKNIVSVEMTDCRRLSSAVIVPSHGVYLPADMASVPLPLASLAECTDESKRLDNVPWHTVTLTAKLREDIPVPTTPTAFILTAWNGERYFMGDTEPPFPKVETRDTMPSRASDASGITVTATRSGAFGLLKILS